MGWCHIMTPWTRRMQVNFQTKQQVAYTEKKPQESFRYKILFFWFCFQGFFGLDVSETRNVRNLYLPGSIPFNKFLWTISASDRTICLRDQLRRTLEMGNNWVEVLSSGHPKSRCWWSSCVKKGCLREAWQVGRWRLVIGVEWIGVYPSKMGPNPKGPRSVSCKSSY